MSSVESVAVDSAGTHAGSHVPVKALRSMAWGSEGMSWLLEEDHRRRRLRRRPIWSAYRWILIRVVSKIKKRQQCNPKTSKQSVSYYPDCWVWVKIKRWCGALLLSSPYCTSLSSVHTPTPPPARAWTLSFCYHRDATLQEKTISDTTGFKVCYCYPVALYPVWLPCDTTPN